METPYFSADLEMAVCVTQFWVILILVCVPLALIIDFATRKTVREDLRKVLVRADDEWHLLNGAWYEDDEDDLKEDEEDDRSEDADSGDAADDEEEPPEPIDLTIEVATTDGTSASLPLSSVRRARTDAAIASSSLADGDVRQRKRSASPPPRSCSRVSSTLSPARTSARRGSRALRARVVR